MTRRANPSTRRLQWEFALYKLRDAMRARLLALRDGDRTEAQRQAEIIDIRCAQAEEFKS